MLKTIKEDSFSFGMDITQEGGFFPLSRPTFWEIILSCKRSTQLTSVPARSDHTGATEIEISEWEAGAPNLPLPASRRVLTILEVNFFKLIGGI